MKKIAVLLVLTWLVAGLAGAEVFKIKSLTLGTTNFQASEKSNGQALWQSVQKAQKVTDKGSTYLFVEENGSGIYGKDKKYQTWDARSYFYIEGDRLIPYQVSLIYKDKDGKTVTELNKYYDRQNGKVVCRDNGSVKQFDFKDDIVDKEDLGFCLMNYPFEQKRDLVCHLLTHEPTLYQVTFKYEGVETLTQDNRPLECYKLEMVPDLGALNIFGAFVPKTYFWYRTAPPHDFVRYEGLESGLGTPYIVMEGRRR